MAPASRRQILSPETLASFGATPLYDQSLLSDSISSSSSSPAEGESPIIVGIKVGKWTIRTQNSSIGDEQAMEELTVMLEGIANNDNNQNIIMEGEAKVPTAGDAAAARRQRRLCPPEITFVDAFLSLRYDEDGGDNTYPNGGVTSSADNDDDTTFSEIRFTARAALSEWAEAHKLLLEMDPSSSPAAEKEKEELKYASEKVLVPSSSSSSSSTSSTSLSPSHRQRKKECRGVSILRTLDAKIWSNKSNILTTDHCNVGISGDSDIRRATPSSHSSEFYYDWTFSSPYAGTILLANSLKSNNSNQNCNITETLINNRQQWHPLPQSNIPFHLLQDTSQPILLYDDIHLFEDDLHDNGESSLNIKIRVMPKCWYVLQRLFVRVDYVCVKCREVRYFSLLDGDLPAAAGGNCKVNAIYRDVTWREASWTELNKMNLPVDPSAWMEHNVSARSSLIGGKTTGVVLPFAALLTKLPVVLMPDDLPKHSFFEW